MSLFSLFLLGAPSSRSTSTPQTLLRVWTSALLSKGPKNNTTRGAVLNLSALTALSPRPSSAPKTSLGLDLSVTAPCAAEDLPADLPEALSPADQTSSVLQQKTPLLGEQAQGLFRYYAFSSLLMQAQKHALAQTFAQKLSFCRAQDLSPSLWCCQQHGLQTFAPLCFSPEADRATDTPVLRLTPKEQHLFHYRSSERHYQHQRSRPSDHKHNTQDPNPSSSTHTKPQNSMNRLQDHLSTFSLPAQEAQHWTSALPEAQRSMASPNTMTTPNSTETASQTPASHTSQPQQHHGQSCARRISRVLSLSFCCGLALSSSLCAAQNPGAEPQGFREPQQNNMRAASTKKPQGNTIRGVLSKAKTDDYVVLEGMFLKQLDENATRFLFRDLSMDTIEVDLPKPTPLMKYKDHSFYIWGQVKHGFSATVIRVKAYSLR